MIEHLVFDIETAPDWGRLEEQHPYRDYFDRDAVPMGNTRLPESVKKKQDEAEAAWNAIPKEERREAHFAEVMRKDETLLWGDTCNLGAVFWWEDGSYYCVIPDGASEEKDALKMVKDKMSTAARIYGWNIAFDLKVVIQRCWNANIWCDPTPVFRGKWTKDHVTCLMAEYCHGDKPSAKHDGAMVMSGRRSLKRVAESYGMEPCPGIGKEWWTYDDEKRRRYGWWDIRATVKVARRHGHLYGVEDGAVPEPEQEDEIAI